MEESKRGASLLGNPVNPKRPRKENNFINENLLSQKFLEEISGRYTSGKPFTSEDGIIQVIQDPFQCCVVKHFINDEEFLKRLKSDLLSLDFLEKSNDLYKFKQSADLKTSEIESIQNLRNILYRDFLSWLRSVTGLSLNDTMDLSCAQYNYTDTLLCHDDELEGRRIAFIFYLVPPWEEKDGGTLDLFSVDEDGQPREIRKVLGPCWNSLIFFEVTPESFHQVSEVLNKEKCRLSISGWFYGETVPRPIVKAEERKTPVIAKEADDEILLKWINPMYLNAEIVETIQDQLEENSEIQLDEFLLEEKYNEVMKEFRSSSNVWKIRGPANKRNYKVIENDEILTPTLKSLVDLMHSEPMFKLLAKLTGLSLAELDPDDNEKRESGTLSENEEKHERSNPSCISEIRNWSHGSYTLMHDSDAGLNEFALDAMLFFGCDDWDSSFGGFTSYIASGEDEELLTVCPTSNCLALVYRDKETVRFVKHINASCNDLCGSNEEDWDGCREFFDISAVYYE